MDKILCLGSLDDEIPSSVHIRMLSELNCTVPFLPLKIRENSQICKKESEGKTGVDMYYSSPIEALNLWTGRHNLQPPCHFYRFDTEQLYSFHGRKHKVWRWYQGNLKYDDAYTDEFWLEFVSEMTVTEQFWTYSFMSYIAENGGFVGLFLGYSVLSFSDFISSILDYLKKCKAGK